MSVNWGIIGCGWITDEQIAPAVRKSANGELTAFLSRDAAKAEQFRARHGAKRAYTDLDALVADNQVDAVFIATPNAQHASETIRCAEAGKHVLVEKPMATSIADAEAMIAACRENQVKLSVGYHMRFHPLHVEAARLVHADKLGAVAFARSQLFFRYPGPPPAWRQTGASAGWWALGDVGTHGLDLLSWLLGEAVEVSAQFGHTRFDFETEDLAVLLLRFKNGAVATLDCSTGVHSPASKFEVYGSEGNLVAENTLGLAASGTLRVGGNTAPLREVPYRSVNPYKAEIEAFNQAVLQDRDLPITPQDGLQNVRVLVAATQAASENRTVAIDSGS